MNKIKEILPDKINAVNESGDVVPHEGYFDNDYEPSEIEPPETIISRGASLNLGRRALAIEALMDHFNKQSKLKGIRSETGSKRLEESYGSKASEVDRGVERKAKIAGWLGKEALNILSGYDELIAQGFTHSEAMAIRRELYQDLKDKFGPGVGSYSNRLKETKKVTKTASKLK